MKTKGLSLAEAHLSNRKYRVVGSAYSYGRYVEKNFIVTENGQDYPAWVLSINAALALYELEPKAKLLTREEVSGVMFLQLNISTMDRQRVLDKLFGSESEEDWKHGPR